MIKRHKPRVVILGGGFGGLATAKALGDSADITVVDRHNYQTFLPVVDQSLSIIRTRQSN